MTDDALKFDLGLARALAGDARLSGALARGKGPSSAALKAEAAALSASGKDSPEEIERAATQFEALLMQQMFQAMWSGVGNGGLFGVGREEEFYRDMLNQALADDVAEKQSVGLKSLIAKDIAKIANRDEK